MNFLRMLLFVLLIGLATVNGSFIEDYCWRDYNGIAPFDAFKAGIDRDGKPIYIGQVLFQNKLIPGKIHENANAIHIEFYRAYTINETIKILCTQHPEHFEWFPIRHDQVLLIKDKHIFEGGYQNNVTTYIGRAYWRGQLTVGKVACVREHYCLKLTTVEGRRFYQHSEFEILIYNPNNKQEDFAVTPSVESVTTKTLIHQGSLSWLWYFSLAVIVFLILIVIKIVRRC
ncbi:hypothetical protein ILUMI_01517 [Ignelater luminosus]|uniref:Uncharacterized protein n=1 Tax=Ignelater luminosus TaxID=2038154 RepID=A0A8K0GK69_IGNLU|nr:hypothetical protein ILUMI_01517 [Ignelater luminosus]